MALEPLKQTHSATDLEDELRSLFIKVYADHLQPGADEINVYGAPFLGSLPLVQRNIVADGVSIISQTEDARTRYLHKAWRYLNPERGLHFLRTYLSAIFPVAFSVEQLWQKKSEPYPTALLPRDQVPSESDYYLTSRVRVDLDTGGIVPDRILQSLKTAMAARFLLKVRVAKLSESPVGVAQIMRTAVMVRVTGESTLPAQFMHGLAQAVTMSTVVYTTAELPVRYKRLTQDGQVRKTQTGADREAFVL